MVHIWYPKFSEGTIKVHDKSRAEFLDDHVAMHKVCCAHTQIWSGAQAKQKVEWKRWELCLGIYWQMQSMPRTPRPGKVYMGIVPSTMQHCLVKSKQQRCVTFSTTEAKMMAMTECIRDVLQSIWLSSRWNFQWLSFPVTTKDQSILCILVIGSQVEGLAMWQLRPFFEEREVEGNHIIRLGISDVVNSWVVTHVLE